MTTRHSIHTSASALHYGARVVRDVVALIRSHRRAFVALNLGYLGMFGLGILATALVPELRPGGLGAVGDPGAGGLGGLIADSYRSGNVALAAVVTLGVNLLSASLLQTTLPTLIVPFLGVVSTLVRGLSWGVLFTPVGAHDALFLVHWVTLAIEGAAYVVVGFAAWVHGRFLLQPQRHGFATRRAGYVGGLLATAKLYALVVALLIIGALYEAITVIFLIA
ncbi:hypothetical protein CLV46_3253 [Diaminobutyricimonas aerilata]|uniref:Stage II sporulation protein M n=1 Tax=Diaminobutyricimonas aerilata TaxID=1162967 RepID=A0A2M9CP82_9MICO|nr:hypothetical protein [Diaminobutyricimonas aerilata]PJJ73658.1 hypothetical protein CLV46_3253 [Diaminobutyricimonas aerilata]